MSSSPQPRRSPCMRHTKRIGFMLSVTTALGCAAGGVGSGCLQDTDCDDGLLCDMHQGKGSCQEAHLHALSDYQSEQNSTGPLPELTRQLDPSLPVPQSLLQALADPNDGYNLHLSVSDFEFTPENVGKPYEDGTGHALLYLDAHPLTRLYGPWFHVSALTPGRHEFRVVLVGNDGSALMSGGALESTISVDVPARRAGLLPEEQEDVLDAGAMVQPNHEEIEDAAAPELRVRVMPDSDTGYNLKLVASGLTFSPERVCETHVFGEGYFELSIGTAAPVRVYEPWFYLPDARPGDSVSIAAMTNDHRPYAVGGEALQWVVELP